MRLAPGLDRYNRPTPSKPWRGNGRGGTPGPITASAGLLDESGPYSYCLASIFDVRKTRNKVDAMLPCQRKTRTQTRIARNHKHLRKPEGVRCPNCGSTKRPHAACSECGYVRPGLKLSLSKEA